jgi:hypothetical protein
MWIVHLGSLARHKSLSCGEASRQGLLQQSCTCSRPYLSRQRAKESRHAGAPAPLDYIPKTFTSVAPRNCQNFKQNIYIYERNHLTLTNSLPINSSRFTMFILIHIWSRGSSPGRGKGSVFSPQSRDGSGRQPSLLSNGYRGWSNRERDADALIYFRGKKRWSYTSTSPYVLMS